MAFGASGQTSVSSMKNQPMVGNMDVLFGKVFDKLFFNFIGSLGIHGDESQSFGYPKDVCIHGHVGLVPDDRGDHIGGFPADSRELGQLINGGRNFALEFFDQHLSQTKKMSGFVAGVGNGFYIGEKFIEIGRSQMFRAGEILKQRRGDDVDPFVGTLCAEYDRDQELERGFVGQFRLCDGHVFRKVLDKGGVSFFL